MQPHPKRLLSTHKMTKHVPLFLMLMCGQEHV